jgi:hypothetical protein
LANSVFTSGREGAEDGTGFFSTSANALRAWAMTQGYEPNDRPYDSYKNGIDNAFTENGQYQAYWGLK